jgi:hypothetical protein
MEQKKLVDGSPRDDAYYEQKPNPKTDNGDGMMADDDEGIEDLLDNGN